MTQPPGLTMRSIWRMTSWGLCRCSSTWLPCTKSNSPSLKCCSRWLASPCSLSKRMRFVTKGQSSFCNGSSPAPTSMPRPRKRWSQAAGQRRRRLVAFDVSFMTFEYDEVSVFLEGEIPADAQLRLEQLLGPVAGADEAEDRKDGADNWTQHPPFEPSVAVENHLGAPHCWHCIWPRVSALQYLHHRLSVDICCACSRPSAALSRHLIRLSILFSKQIRSWR